MSSLETHIHTCSTCSTLLDISEQEPFAKIRCPGCGTEMRVRTQFDQYELVEPIAAGGMGMVYKARDTNLNRIVALKLIRKEFSEDHEYIAKLETEAKVTASISHPNVVKVYSFGCAQGLYYIAMELVDKGSLDDLMNLQGRVAEIQVLEIGIQAAQGLRAAYQAGLIHRDVKPGNILFADAHTAKIVDFGLAMPLEQAREASEEIWGTPYYVAPEKLNHEPEDFRSDIYSLGGTLFHALAGRPPYEAANASLVALKHLKSQPVSLQTFAPDISSPTSYVINRMLAKNPDDRYQSYDELIEHLTYARTKLQESLGQQRAPKARVVVVNEHQQKITSYLLIGVTVLVVAVGALIYAYKDEIAERNMSPAERERVRLLKAASEAEASFMDARKQLVQGKAAEAYARLSMLNRRGYLAGSTRTWSVALEGIAAFLSDMPIQARAAFTRLNEEKFSAGDQALGTFFGELARVALRNGTEPESTAELFGKGEYEPIGLLTAALKEWQGERFENAAFFFNRFLNARFEGSGEWATGFKSLVWSYLTDYEAAKELLERLKVTRFSDRRALLPEVVAVKEKLQRKGALYRHLTAVQRYASRTSGDVNLRGLYDTATQAVVDFKPGEGIEALKAVPLAEYDQPVRDSLLEQLKAVEGFKNALIQHFQTARYDGTSFDLKNRHKVSGQLLGVSSEGIKVGTGSGETTIPWTQLSTETILRLASHKEDLQSVQEATAKQAPFLWYAGTYLALTRKDPAAAWLLLCRAAEAHPAYAEQLPWFDFLKS